MNNNFIATLLIIFVLLNGCQTIKKIHTENKDHYDLFFANGGDQNNDTIPERDICEKLNIQLIDGLGDKIQSSSWLLKNKK